MLETMGTKSIMWFGLFNITILWYNIDDYYTVQTLHFTVNWIALWHHNSKFKCLNNKPQNDNIDM